MKRASQTASSSLGLSVHRSGVGGEGPCYIYQLQPLQSGDGLAALCSDESVRAFDPSRPDSGAAWVHPTGQEAVTQLRTQVLDGERFLMLTAARDGTVRVWDQRVGGAKSARAMGVGESEPGANKAAVLALAVCPGLPVIATGTEQDADSKTEAAISLWDLRYPEMPHLKYTESHNDDITELHFHPSSPSTLLSASSDGLVNIFNTSISDEDDALVQIINHGSAVHHANFLSETEVFALSSDEQLSVYRRTGPSEPEDEDGQDPPAFAFGDVRPALGCEYVVDVLSANGTGLVHAGNYSKRILDLVPLKPTPVWEFRPEEGLRLDGAHGVEIVRCVHVDNKNNTIFTGGEDGIVRTWKADDRMDKGKGDEMDES